jgi:predicted ribosome quality control (RQC) complex YloA/Tae2 family protein
MTGQLMRVQVAARAVRTREVRGAAWFERFAWFVSSENCLVLAARDAQQADLLLKRHLRCAH